MEEDVTFAEYLLAHWAYFFYVAMFAIYLPILAIQLPEKAKVL